MSATGRSPSSRIDGWFAAALCGLGAVLRIVMFAQHRSLWYDEAAIALNVVNRGFAALLAPLDNLQTAPPLFLWAERVAVMALGPNDWALRVVPLVAGLLLPPLMWRVARRLLPAPAALVAVALVALSPALVRYSAEVKPYVIDALVTVLLIDRAIPAAEPNATRSAWWSLGIVGALALLASTPVVFVLAGVVAYLAWELAARRGVRALAPVAAIAVGWAVVFLVLLATVFRPVVDPAAPIGRFMQWYWATNFLTPDPPGLRTKISALLWAVLTNTFVGDGALPGMTTGLVLVVASGLVALIVKRRGSVLALLTVPLAAVIAASMLRRYPIAERLVLFAAPLSALLMASAPLAVERIHGGLATSIARAAALGVTVLACLGVFAMYRSNDGRQESRDLVRTAAAARAAGTPVWVSAGAAPAWRFYSGDPALAETDTLATAGRSFRQDTPVGAWYTAIPERIVTVVDDTVAVGQPSPWSDAEANRLRAAANPCVLVFLSHAMPGEAAALLTSAARLGGRPTETKRQPGAELHRVCFDPKG